MFTDVQLVYACVLRYQTVALEERREKQCLFERSLQCDSKDRCMTGASSGLLISMHGMSEEARGPETGTSSYCGGGEKSRANISVQQTFLSSQLGS